MTTSLLVAGTASHVGKSVVVAGLCRLLAQKGVPVAPFKAQNMSNNARAVLKPVAASSGGVLGSVSGGEASVTGTHDEASVTTSDQWGEIGISQYVQARAARVTPTTDLSPVLLKPRGDGESQLVIQGDAVTHVEAGAYYDAYWERARRAAEESYRRLAEKYDVVVAEGAGSIAEINLHDRDLANVEFVRFADDDVVLVVDIERGGAFASLVGTLELVPDDVRERIVGVVINKFRGRRAILQPGIKEFEERTDVPVLGVLPYDDPGLPEEDSVSLPATDERSIRGDDDGVPDDRAVTVAVVRLPRISNFTDFEPLEREPGVRVAYVPPTDDLSKADAVVLPGTKNTVDDLLALREAGFDERLETFEGPIVGICGGYQMLGERITNADIEGTGDRTVVDGFGLLPIETRFLETKRVTDVTRSIDGVGPFEGASGEITGYEIHMGESTPVEPVDQPLGEGSTATDRVVGTYLHGLFENDGVRRAFVRSVFESAHKRPPPGKTDRPSPYNRAATLVDEHVGWSGMDWWETMSVDRAPKSDP